MRFLVSKGLRYLFYVMIGASLVLVTTPSLAGAFPGSGSQVLWPITGLLAYLLHLFEDTGKLAGLLRPADRKSAIAGLSSGVPSKSIEQV
ncbi:MAG: hypothetical protein WD178_05785 [Actinomycetota bacterium]